MENRTTCLLSFWLKGYRIGIESVSYQICMHLNLKLFSYLTHKNDLRCVFLLVNKPHLNFFYIY